jgi:uncharacterized membrane protein
MNVSWPALLVICGVLIAIVLVLFWHPQRSRTKTSTPADRQPTFTIFRDDDRYWSAGFFYNNPDDPALFVPKRFGLGWTLNFGHPQSKWFIITVLVLMLVLLLLPLVVALLGGGSVHSSGCHSLGCQP